MNDPLREGRGKRTQLQTQILQKNFVNLRVLIGNFFEKLLSLSGGWSFLQMSEHYFLCKIRFRKLQVWRKQQYFNVLSCERIQSRAVVRVGPKGTMAPVDF